MSGIAIVTDSTAALPTEVVGSITIVPLGVVIDGRAGSEGVDVTPVQVATALADRRPVTTSRPSPEAFCAAYDRLLAEGADGILSIHLSRTMSGTIDSASLAARNRPGLIEVIDSRSSGLGLGFPVLAAARAAASGQDLSGVRAAAVAAIDMTTSLFYVDTLEFLRRGGRIGAASALLGTALAMKPILGVDGTGTIVALEKVRTASRALARLADLAVEAAGGARVDVGVQHVAAPERARALADELAGRLSVRHHYVGEAGASLAAHAGPGLVGVVVHRLAD
jgi:DegV family protein with EDD domain